MNTRTKNIITKLIALDVRNYNAIKNKGYSPKEIVKYLGITKARDLMLFDEMPMSDVNMLYPKIVGNEILLERIYHEAKTTNTPYNIHSDKIEILNIIDSDVIYEMKKEIVHMYKRKENSKDSLTLEDFKKSNMKFLLLQLLIQTPRIEGISDTIEKPKAFMITDIPNEMLEMIYKTTISLKDCVYLISLISIEINHLSHFEIIDRIKVLDRLINLCNIKKPEKPIYIKLGKEANIEDLKNLYKSANILSTDNENIDKVISILVDEDDLTKIDYAQRLSTYDSLKVLKTCDVKSLTKCINTFRKLPYKSEYDSVFIYSILVSLMSRNEYDTVQKFFEYNTEPCIDIELDDNVILSNYEKYFNALSFITYRNYKLGVYRGLSCTIEDYESILRKVFPKIKLIPRYLNVINDVKDLPTK